MSKLDMAMKEINKLFGQGSAHRGLEWSYFPRIPFSSPLINFMTFGGVPRGRIIEIFGADGCGKTTTSLDLVGNAQKVFAEDAQARETTPKEVVYVDIENTMDFDWAAKLGVKTDDMYIIQPTSQSAEVVLESVLDIIETGEVGLIVLDSIGALLSEEAYNKELTDKVYAGASKALTRFASKAEMLCAKHNTTLIGINQVRDNVGSMYGGLTTPGGRGWRHACSLRLQCNQGQYLDRNYKEVKKSEANPYGIQIQIALAKSKCFPPTRRQSHYSLSFAKGILKKKDLIELAAGLGIVSMSGCWYEYDGIKAQGMTNFARELTANKAKLQALNEAVMSWREDDEREDDDAEGESFN